MITRQSDSGSRFEHIEQNHHLTQQMQDGNPGVHVSDREAQIMPTDVAERTSINVTFRHVINKLHTCSGRLSMGCPIMSHPYRTVLRIGPAAPLSTGDVMPYIPQSDRAAYDETIRQLARTLHQQPAEKRKGHANYVVTQILRAGRWFESG